MPWVGYACWGWWNENWLAWEEVDGFYADTKFDTCACACFCCWDEERFWDDSSEFPMKLIAVIL